MRKSLFLVIGLVVVVVILSRSDEIGTFIATVQTGAWLPLVVAAGFEVGKFFSQSYAVTSAFEATGAKRNPKKLLPVVFSAMFVNSLAPSGGTAGTLLYIEDARRDGVPVAQSTPAILLYDVAYFGGFLLIMVIGFAVLAWTHALSVYYIIAGILLVLIAAGLSLILVFGRKWPHLLRRFAEFLESKLNQLVTEKMHRKPMKPWADKLVDTFSSAANSIAESPRPALTAVAYMTLTAGCDMLAMTAIGFAFGFTKVPLLVGAYVAAQLLTIFSPTPQGVGIVEVGLALLLTSFGVSGSVSTAIALVYRGYVYWIPFLIGALSLQRTKLFTSTKPATAEEKAKETAHVIALVMIAIAVLSILFAILPAAPGAWQAVADWLANGVTLSPTYIVVSAILLVLLSRGLWMRNRTSWAISMVVLLLETVFLLSAGRGLRVAIVLIAMAVWMFVRRGVFDQVQTKRRTGFSRYAPVLFAFAVTFLYGTAGFLILAGSYENVSGFGGAVHALLWSLVPVGQSPGPLDDHATWFINSVRVVFWLSIVYVVVSVLYGMYGGKVAARLPWYSREPEVDVLDENGEEPSRPSEEEETEAAPEDGTAAAAPAGEIPAGKVQEESRIARMCKKKRETEAVRVSDKGERRRFWKR
jgi:phosphatidylglycerol lysyltransferase